MSATQRHEDIDQQLESLRRQLNQLTLEKKVLEKDALEKEKQRMLADQEKFWEQEKKKNADFWQQQSANAELKLAELAKEVAESRRKEAERKADLLGQALLYGYVTSTSGSVRVGPKPAYSGQTVSGQTVSDLVSDYQISPDQFVYQVTVKTAHWDRNCPSIKDKKTIRRVKVNNCLGANACSKCCNF